MLTAIKQRLDREEEGFTLIELMVVVLIIAILLAIAIPTFLGARNTANARSAQSNLRNALTAEQTNWTNTQSFATGLGAIEPSLSWGTDPTALVSGAKSVSVELVGTQGVYLHGYAKDGNCYGIFQSNDPTSATSDFTAYEAYKGACTASAATVPATPTAAGNGAVAAATGTWHTSW
jgi:type IV pilus assembly protein PilA